MAAKLTLSITAGLLWAGIAIAQSGDRAAKMDRHFSYTDKDGSGFIEHREVVPYPVLVKHFSMIDANNDGKLSKTELQDYRLGKPQKAHAARVKQ
jgi:Ca2+-binding EF-hand superfamily protein